MDRLRKTTKNLSQDSRSLSQGLNPGPPKYKEGALTTRPQHLVSSVKLYILLECDV
jgi:hypothetical protein